MNNYFKVTFKFDNYTEVEGDILSALLCDIGFESFEVEDDFVIGYIKEELFKDNAIDQVLPNYDFKSTIDWQCELIEGKDWNEEWEKNYFKPIIIANKCVIHSTFHTDIPILDYDIVIDPKMAFGTGHHETTSLMITNIIDSEIDNKTIADVGTGTGILSILCSMRGAKYVKGIEIDPQAQINAVENIELNNINNVDIILGDANELEKDIEKYDILLANINRNIILQDIDKYAHSLKSGGYMQLSGFYTQDASYIIEEARKYRLELIKEAENNNWAMLFLRKE